MCMLKKTLVAAVLLAGLGTPAVAQAATSSPQQVSNVKLAWVDGKVKITWTESAAAANTIAVEVAGKPAQPLGSTTAAGPNELIVPASALVPSFDPASTATITVAEPGSPSIARSAAFDRYIRASGGMDRGIAANGELNWAFGPDQATDSTPKDPLDLTQPGRFVPRLTRSKSGACEKVVLPATTTPYGVVPRQSGPFALDMGYANEWGERRVDGVKVRTSATTLSAPASTTFGSTIALTGGIALWGMPDPAGGFCGVAGDPAALGNLEVVLHARNSATSSWYAVTVTRTDASGKYSFAVRNPGAREYRAVLKHGAAGGLGQYQSISASKVVRATTKVMSAKFLDPVLEGDEKPNAYLWVEPAGSQAAVLQFKNYHGVWENRVTKTLSSGRGLTGPFNYVERGVTSYRWSVPASLSGGLPVDGVNTGVFTLTTP